jgi:hypothetical protein
MTVGNSFRIHNKIDRIFRTSCHALQAIDAVGVNYPSVFIDLFHWIEAHRACSIASAALSALAAYCLNPTPFWKGNGAEKPQ